MGMFNGFGTTYYGVKNRVVEEELEEYDTTKWVCMLWLPIFPLGSYRIRRPIRKDIVARIAREVFSKERHWLVPRAFDRRQVAWIYFCVYGWYFILLALILSFTLVAALSKK
jgi:hypothetical protein